MVTEAHISSLVVHAMPAKLPAVSMTIGRLPGAEVHAASEQGKLVVTLEASNEQEMLAGIDAIHRIEGVVSAALVFHQVEDAEMQE